MRCPSCGGAELIREIRDLPYTYKGHTLTVPAQPGLYCPACGEAVFDEAESLRYEAVVKPFVQGVNARAMPDIRAIRKRLSLTQAEAGRLFGGGVNAFSRYERHEVEPPVALVKLLKLLDRHPELVGEIRGE